MAVTTTYAFENVKSEFIASYSADANPQTDETRPSITALADGGYAIAYITSNAFINTYSIHLERYTIGGVLRPSADIAGVTYLGNAPIMSAYNSPVTIQLANGNILVSWVQAGGAGTGTHFSIVNAATGAVITADTPLPGTDSGDGPPHIVALQNGGFAVVKTDFSGGNSNLDADLLFYNSAGVLQTTKALGNDSTSNERNPAVTVLNNGNVAVAYESEKTDGSGTYSMAIQLFTQTGAIVSSPIVFDPFGENTEPENAALKDGGFAVAYDDTGWVQGGVSVAFFNANGSLRSIQRVDPDASADADVSLSVLPNGYVVLTWTDNSVDVLTQVFDPVTMTMLGGARTVIEDQSGTQTASVVAGLGNGTFVTAWSDYNNAVQDGNTDPFVAHVSMQIDQWVRTSNGDAVANSIVGDALIDKIFGNGGADDLFGNGNNDQIYGAAGADYLSGGAGTDYLSGGSENDTFFGGAGTDTMVGGDGDDSYYIQVGDTGDLVAEYAGGGTADRIYSAISYSLALSSQVETLSTNSNAGTANLNLVGSNSANTIIGNNGSNIINGMGGNDVLYGGGGTVDYFVFNLAPSTSSNYDRIADWSSAGDLIFLDNAIFLSLGAGTLTVSEFRSAAGATSAATAAQNIIHNSTNGDLWYDADGVGGTASVRFANVGAGNPIFYYDFFGI